MAPLENFVANRIPVVAMIASGSRGDEFNHWFSEFGAWFAQQWEQFLAWASQPRTCCPRPTTRSGFTTGRLTRFCIDVIAAVLAWLITFWIVCIIILGLGFGPVGVIAGMSPWAARMQVHVVC
jgi:hypothetical protein